MGQFLEELPQCLIEWILKQQMFWVASAPLSLDGHINISPKAIEGTFHVVNPRRVWYEDLSGSGTYCFTLLRRAISPSLTELLKALKPCLTFARMDE
jgi:hypothetical protein